MNYFNIIFLSLLTVSIILYAIFYFKNLKLQSIIAASFHIPLLYAAAFSFLINFYPDSLHILFFYSLFFIFLTLANIFIRIEKKIFIDIAQLLFCAAFLIFVIHLSSIFLTKHIASWTSLFPVSIFIISTTLTIIFSKNKKLSFIASACVPITVTSLLIYLTTLNLYFYSDLSAILLFAGSILLHLIGIFFTLNKIRIKFKHGNFVSYYAMLIALAIFSSALILMIK